MASRSRTSEFKNARKSLYNSKKENSLIGLEYAHDNGLGDIIDLTPSHIRSFGLLPLPPWMSKQLTTIQQQLDDIRLNSISLFIFILFVFIMNSFFSFLSLTM